MIDPYIFDQTMVLGHFGLEQHKFWCTALLLIYKTKVPNSKSQIAIREREREREREILFSFLGYMTF